MPELRNEYSHLNNLQKGSFAEAYSKMAFTLEGFEVYSPEYDDRGIDFVIRNNSEKFFSVQVKATDKMSNPFIKANKFKATNDFMFCAVRLIDKSAPAIYIARGNEWKSNIDCLHFNPNGGAAGPYYEIKFADIYMRELNQFKFRNYIEKIKN